MKYLLILALCCFGTLAEAQTLYTWVSSLRIRSAPNLEAETIAKLRFNRTVEWTGKKSNQTTEISI